MLQRSLDGQAEATQPYKTAAQENSETQHNTKSPRPPVPKLAIVLMCAGTRGDVQPFIALGLKLKVTAVRISLLMCINKRSDVRSLTRLLSASARSQLYGLSKQQGAQAC